MFTFYLYTMIDISKWHYLEQHRYWLLQCKRYLDPRKV